MVESLSLKHSLERILQDYLHWPTELDVPKPRPRHLHEQQDSESQDVGSVPEIQLREAKGENILTFANCAARPKTRASASA